ASGVRRFSSELNGIITKHAPTPEQHHIHAKACLSGDGHKCGTRKYGAHKKDTRSHKHQRMFAAPPPSHCQSREQSTKTHAAMHQPSNQRSLPEFPGIQ
ncbi:hypothetical protein, partial [Paenibacillus graminis]|uniref:hypothetical protein n=1 Tax=Paenibacillus graminis TaxID=189425 RepID=UPI00056591BC